MCMHLSMRKQAHKGLNCLYAECINTFHPTDQKAKGSYTGVFLTGIVQRKIPSHQSAVLAELQQ